MCGIVGHLNLDGSDLTSDKSFLSRMCQSIHHRGPDESGQIVVGPAALGMTRLSIIDLNSGQQPIPNEDRSIWIVFNGEIYNHQALRKTVLEKGHKLSTSTDTEIIVHLYEEYGVDCLHFLEGMFAFAIWDTKKERLFIARDRFGEKPLHYGVFSNQLIFGSELKGILSHPDSKSDLNIEALQQYLSLEYVPAPNTIFSGIKKLMPACFMLVREGQINIQKYWSPKPAEVPDNEQEMADRLIELLKESVRLRLLADVPVGVFLSGGIDSSGIAALATEVSEGTVNTFSIGFSDSAFDESVHAETMAKVLGTNHQSGIFTADQAADTLEELWQFIDEPIADAAILPTYFLSKMTKKSVKVALAGEGGDELFGGYPTYFAHKLADIWTSIPDALRTKILEPAIRSMPVSMDYLSLDYKAKRFIESANLTPVNRHMRWMGSIPIQQQQELLKKEFVLKTNETDLLPAIVSSSGVQQERDVVFQAMQLDMLTYLPDGLLVKADRSSMAASLELRLPFLAYPLAEFALGLPTNLKVRGTTTKYLLKKALCGRLPQNILKRAKKGFGVPVSKWMRKEFKPMIDEVFCDSFLKKQGIFNAEVIRTLVEEHQSQKFDRRKQLWTLFMFQRWWQKFGR
jgi:asparagine synthase (glutamine-hydrolysing)